MTTDNGDNAKKVMDSCTNYSALLQKELVEKCVEKDALIEQIKSKNHKLEDELKTLHERLRSQQQATSRRENELLMKLTNKEQELQDYVVQLQEMQQANKSAVLTHIKSTMLDPAVNATIQNLSKQLQSAKEQLDQFQNDMAASKFTLESQAGRRLVAKCKLLIQENEDLGKIVATGRVAKLEAELALERALVAQLRDALRSRDDDMQDVDDELEGLQGIVMSLQQRLAAANQTISSLKQQLPQGDSVQKAPTTHGHRSSVSNDATMEVSST